MNDIRDKYLIPLENTFEVVGQTDARNAIELSWDTGYPTILVGHSGTAKTSILARMHAEAGRPYRAVSCYGAVEADSLIGKWVVQDGSMVYRLGVLPFCMKYGISLGFQEINFVLPEVLVLLHEYFDEGRITLLELDPDHPDFVITAHPDFRFFGTMNPPEYYPGARDLSPAFVRRSLMVHVDVISPEDETNLVAQRTEIPLDLAINMTAAAVKLRAAFTEHHTATWVGTADLVTWGLIAMAVTRRSEVAAAIGPDLFAAAIPTIINKGNTPEDRQFLRDTIRTFFAPVTAATDPTDLNEAF